MLQPSFESPCFLIIAFGTAGLIWALGAYYRYRGTILLSQLSRGQISQVTGFGSWYARTITGNLRAVLYSMVHHTLIPLTFLAIGLILTPSDFGQLLDRIWPTIPFFMGLGLACGIDIGYRWRGIGEEPANEASYSHQRN